jgi:hypothetical protein
MALPLLTIRFFCDLGARRDSSGYWTLLTKLSWTLRSDPGSMPGGWG